MCAIGIVEGDEILLINEKQVTGMKLSTLQQHFRGINMQIMFEYDYDLQILTILFTGFLSV